jgi:hypothetical protein
MAAAMRLGEPDRVPVMCQLALGHYFLNAGPSAVDIWHATEDFAWALVGLQRRYGFDGILVNLPGRDPDWRSHVAGLEVKDGNKVIRWMNGWRTVCPPDDNPRVLRENGREFRARFEDVDPETLYYVEPYGLEGLKYPHSWEFSPEPAPLDRFFPPWQYDAVDLVIRSAGGSTSVHGEIFSPFSQFLELLGFVEGLTALKLDAGKCLDCLSALARGAVELGVGLAGRGVDAVLISSAFAGGGFISPRHYETFVLPFERAVIRGIKARHDLPVYTHTCGRIGDRLELMEATGTDGIDTLDPPPLGDVELADAKARVGRRLFLKGNIDPVNVVLNDDARAVREAARRCLDAAKAGGGYILSTACSVPPHAPPENVAEISRTAEEFGRYGRIEFDRRR